MIVLKSGRTAGRHIPHNLLCKPNDGPAVWGLAPEPEVQCVMAGAARLTCKADVWSLTDPIDSEIASGLPRGKHGPFI